MPTLINTHPGKAHLNRLSAQMLVPGVMPWSFKGGTEPLYAAWVDAQHSWVHPS